MAAFDKVKCGIPQMDEAIDYIRLGDNVVFRVSSLEAFKLFCEIPLFHLRQDFSKCIIIFIIKSIHKVTEM
ncbi:hypothetical protein [Pseudobutyrivibrio xylanivorans]|uniref:Uncharacterized protein n=1 Tax=Pseudobutyrivibrio xylanivorans TaxID=185007 RepID=A0A5P6VWA2_PSEXY|nr:hypothetical protein [Pseudobutyrivibrio xylanivorans]QFJ56361.1 hypothetical protein FXF36_15720 [Pseudobutyrivibrio xylanivorans]